MVLLDKHAVDCPRRAGRKPQNTVKMGARLDIVLSAEQLETIEAAAARASKLATEQTGIPITIAPSTWARSILLTAAEAAIPKELHAPESGEVDLGDLEA